jgi:hypothetical protein
MLPGHALPSNMVWNAGVGPWWAATAESKSKQYSHRSQTFVSMGPANSVPNTLKVCEATPAVQMPQLVAEGLTA